LPAGALKATGGRGLQPAMDHILENEGKPIPTDGGSSTGATGGGDEDEDEDLKLAKSLSEGGGDAQEAKVRVWLVRMCIRSDGVGVYAYIVYQMLRMWQGV